MNKAGNILEMGELVDKIYSTPHPYNTFYLEEMKSRLQWDDRYNEFIVAINSELNHSEDSNMAKLLRERVPGISKFILANSDIDGTLFDNTKTFGEVKDFVFKPRHEAEYNLKYKQLCVSAMIFDGEEFIFLQNTSNHRLANKLTMVQGHVDFSKEIHTMPILEYLKRTIVKEIEEELVMHDIEIVDIKPQFIINDREGDIISLEHYGLVFLVKINRIKPDNSDAIMSNEPEKHKVIGTKLENIDMTEVDGWTKLVLNELMGNKLA